MLTGFHRIGIGAGIVAALQTLSLPAVCFVTLYASTFVVGVELTDDIRGSYLALGLVASLLSYIVTRPRSDELAVTTASAWARAEKLTLSWAIVVAILLLLGYVGNVVEVYSRRALIVWLLVTPPLSLAVWILFRAWLRRILIHTGTTRNVVIAGLNEVGQRLASNMRRHPELGLSLKGFFDDRNLERLGKCRESVLLGKLKELPDYVRQNQIDTIFIAIPISFVQRTRDLLDDLKDTTASIYFVPDIFVVDLIQSRSDEINGVPVIALCETPFYGWRAILKRASDILLASILLLFAAPLLLIIAIAIKLTTQGSVLFKQRRYGLDGEEIIVYKFRTMTASDDGKQIQQASRNDPRVTPLGRILRKYSLDELPQLINVLQGRMSVVGPRPHAIAHNEEYRKLIDGYMVRHKVTPGITGLAQVSGCRGETANLEDMEKRIYYDLQYLREWRPLLDIKIMLRTIKTLLADKQAY